MIPGTADRPADVFLPSWKQGRDTAYDVTVVNSLRKDRVGPTALDHNYTLEMAKREKYRRYGPPCEQENVVFIPLPAEVLGGWEDTAAKEIGLIGKALERQTGQEEGQGVRHLFQRLSIAIQKANATMWIGGEPDPAEDSVTGAW